MTTASGESRCVCRACRAGQAPQAYNGDMADSRGNALHQLQVFVHPHVKHVITQTFRAEEVEDLGDRDESYVHMWRQAIRIQRGEQVDQVEALLPDTPSSE
jgi:hypothetical protein